MMENKDLIGNVKTNLRSVIQSSKGGVPFDRLQRDYRDLVGTPIPFRDLGYNSLDLFIRDIPDVIRLNYQGGSLMAQAVADETTEHISSLVERQKWDSKKRNQRRPSRLLFNQRALARRRTPSIPPFRAEKPPLRTNYAQSNFSSNNAVTHKNEYVPTRRSFVPPRLKKLKERSPSQEETPMFKIPLTQTLDITPSFEASSNVEFESPNVEFDSSSSPNSESFNVIATPPLENRKEDISLDFLISTTKSAKELIEKYAEQKGIKCEFTASHYGQKKRDYLSRLKLDGNTYVTYPENYPTAELAIEAVAKQAIKEIKKIEEHKRLLRETQINNTETMQLLVKRIEDIVCEKPTGMFTNGILREYENTYQETLPDSWLEIIRNNSSLEINVPVRTNIAKDIYIVRPSKSSGDRTPSSSSSKTDYREQNFDASLLIRNMGSISLAKAPPLEYPDGNQWPLFITYVVSTSVMAARIIDYADNFLQLSEEMKSFYSSRNFNPIEIFENHLYAAYMDDGDEGLWHRVCVEKIEGQQVYCHFLDDGDKCFIDIKNIQALEDRFLVLPFQAIHIKLADLEDVEHLISLNMLESIIGQTLIAEVMSNPEKNEAFSVILYDTSGEDDVNLNYRLRERAILSAMNNQLPKLHTTARAYLTHATPEGDIFIRLTSPINSCLEKELQRLSPLFEKASLNKIEQIALKTLCVAKYSIDEQWYRAVLVSYVDEKQAQVYFLDYGHTSIVKVTDLCQLESICKFLAELPPQAIKCRLYDVLPAPHCIWTPAAIQKLEEMAGFGEELIIRVISEAGADKLPEVKLCKRNEDSYIITLNDTLACSPELFSNVWCSATLPDVAVSAEEHRRALLAYSEELPPTSIEETNIPPVRSFFNILIPLAASPSNFYVQPLSTSKQLDCLFDQMQHFYSNQENFCEMHPSLLKIGRHYAAHYKDRCWYRVRLTHLGTGEFVGVHFVDFGDSDSIALSDLQPLYDQFTKLPTQALKASLWGVQPRDTDWDPLHCVAFQDIVKEKKFVSVIRHKDPLVLELIDTSDPHEDVYIDKLLIQKGFAVINR